ncbi:MAG: hypothetical protein MK108_15120 [Mariniblastus sp.]|nr:hypothetical protein [Mariniblastus sp.]
MADPANSTDSTSLSLEPQQIIKTVGRLQARIEERFPRSGLSQVCGQLEQISQQAQKKTEWIDQPILWMRILVWLGCGLFVALCLFSIYLVVPSIHGGWSGEAGAAISENSDLEVLVPNIEAELNVLILLGGAIFFLWTAEKRYKRARALAAIHELRSIAHIIDMHQLTKDPERLLISRQSMGTPTSPELGMSQFELRRYLDYCSEMLALTGKIAALYVRRFDDSVALASANEVEALTTGLCQKIWQKILILHSYGEDGPGRTPLLS